MRTPAVAGWAVRRVRELTELPLSFGHGRAAVPPRRLRARTGAPGLRDWEHGGRVAAGELASALGGSLEGFHSVLDFGCGSGRVLPHVAALAPRARGTGCDVDAGAIAWADAHHPGLQFVVCGSEPPLPFADRAFDLVYSISVLSHLEEAAQRRWLEEVARVLAPGGTALLSIHGPSAFEHFRTGGVRSSWIRPGAFARAPLGDEEFVFEPYIRSRWNQADLPGVSSSYGLTFHGPQYVHEVWKRWFDVVQIVPGALTGWQDLAVLRRPAS